MSNFENTSPTQIDNWESHWTKFAESTEVNPAQKFRFKLILKFLKEKKVNTTKILDLGSGQGDLIRICSKELPHSLLLGIDKSNAGIEISKSKVPRANFLVCDLTENTSIPEQFKNWATVTICSEVLEHLEQPEKFLINAQAYMDKNSFLIVTVPGGPKSAFDKYIGHKKHYTKYSLQALLEEAGMNVQFCWSAGFPFFNLYKMIVCLRGEKLVDDVAKKNDHCKQSKLVLFVMRIFETLFLMNLVRWGYGWQMVAVAKRRIN